jgi:hypothetical protein
MEETTMIDKVNQSTFDDLSVFSYYKYLNSLQIPEQLILDKIEKEVRDRK